MFVNVPSLVDPTLAPPRASRVQPRGAADAVRPPGRLGSVERTAAMAGAGRGPLRERLPRVDRGPARDDPGRVRARVPPPPRPRHQLRRRSARRPAQRRPGADPLRDRRARASTSPARRRSPAPASGAPAGATARPSCSPRPRDAASWSSAAAAARAAAASAAPTPAGAGPAAAPVCTPNIDSSRTVSSCP